VTAAAAAGWACHAISSVAGVIGIVVALVVIAALAEFLHVLVDLPLLVALAGVWALLTMTSVLDLLVHLPYLWRPGNRIVLGVLGINLPFALYGMSWVTLT
jgi:hypothetical protein